MDGNALFSQINSLPLIRQKEVADFVEFLSTKTKTKSKLKAREFGFAKGKIKLAPDFDAPLDDFKEYM
jgi:Protein of unknown function (DUF2281)